MRSMPWPPPWCMSRSPACATAAPAQGTGSGVIVSPDGLMLTNNHVIDAAQTISVSLSDGRKFAARVLGRDPDTDLAVLRGETGETLPTAQLANSKQRAPGPDRHRHRQSLWASSRR